MNPNLRPPNDDVETIELLSHGLERLEPLPTSALEQAYGAHHMAALSAEVATLIFDSLETKQPVMRRGGENESRFLRFTNDSTTIDLSLMADGSTIIGEIDPVIADQLVLEDDDDNAVAVPVDQYGRFRVSSNARTFRLRIVDHLVTQWISR